jgi:hypothetical protein
MKVNNKINYKRIATTLKGKETEELLKSVAEDLKTPDRPLSMKELSELRDAKNDFTTAIDWGTQELTEKEIRDAERLQIQKLDEELENK